MLSQRKEKSMETENIAMNYEQFLTLLTESLQKKLGNGYQFISNEYPITNGIIKHSLTIKNGKSNIYPSICMNPYYFDYINKTSKLDDIAQAILQIYKQNKINHAIDTSAFMDWNHIRHRIRCRLINTEKNKNLLLNVPHREILDLSIVYYLSVKMPGGTEGSIHLCNEHLKLWNTDEKNLCSEAWQNLHTMKDAVVCNINDIIKSVSGEIENNSSHLFSEQMYILTNQRKLYGAVHMSDLKQLAEIASKIDNDLLILPSSIHEVILIPYNRISNTAALADIVSKINATELSPDEILSYHVYHFSRGTGRISIEA